MNNIAYIVIEVNEIRRHAFFLGMLLKKPVSAEEAADDWVNTELPKEFHEQCSRRENEIEAMCGQYCEPGTCRGAYACPLTSEEIREALGGEYHKS